MLATQRREWLPPKRDKENPRQSFSDTYSNLKFRGFLFVCLYLQDQRSIESINPQTTVKIKASWFCSEWGGGGKVGRGKSFSLTLFCLFWKGSTEGYLAFKKNSLEPNEGFISVQASFRQCFVYHISVLANGALAVPLPFWGHPYFSPSLGGCGCLLSIHGAWRPGRPIQALCYPLAFWEPFIQATAQQVSPLWVCMEPLGWEKKPSPSGEREGESYSHLKCWSQGNTLVLSEDACCLTYYGKWGQGPSAAWQGALLVTTANSSGLWWLLLGWLLALLIISGASLLLSNLSPICNLRIVICSLAVLSRLGDLSSKHLLPPALEAGSPRSRCQPVWCVMRVCLLVCRRLPSCFVLSWQECKLWSLPFL